MFLAVWISLSVNIGRHDQCVGANGGHDHSKPCDTIYTALAFAIADWLLFSFTFFSVGWALSTKNEHVHEKSTGASGGAAVRPSDDGTTCCLDTKFREVRDGVLAVVFSGLCDIGVFT